MDDVHEASQHGPPLPDSVNTYGRAAPRTFQVAGGWLVGGVVAAGLGLGASAVLVMLLWITSPYSDSTPGDALRIAADVWLLAHGTQLVREATLSGHPAPMDVTPLLLVVLPAWLLYRGARSVVAADREEQQGEHQPLTVAVWYAGGYLLTGTAATVFAATGPVRADLLSALLQLPLFVLSATAVGTWAGTGCPLLRLPAALRSAKTKSLRRVLNWPRLLGVSRAVGTGVAGLFGGGALLLTGALLCDLPAARVAFPQLAGDWTGLMGVLLLAVTLIPNAALWGAAYALGPGFTLGAGSVTGPMSAGNPPPLPQFPLLAALPGADMPVGQVLWAVVGVLPLTAGVLCGWYLGREAAPVRGLREGARSWRGAVLNAGLAAVGCGLATAVLTAYAGGALGTGVLSGLGPDALLTGAAAAGWTAVPGAPVALIVRAVRLRPEKPEKEEKPEREAKRKKGKQGEGKGAGEQAEGEAGEGLADPV